MARESEDEILETIKELLRERIPAMARLAARGDRSVGANPDADAPRHARHDSTQSRICSRCSIPPAQSLERGGHDFARAATR